MSDANEANQRWEELFTQGFQLTSASTSSSGEKNDASSEQRNKESDQSVREEKIALVKNALEWSENEEIALLEAIKKFGLLDCENLMKCIPLKRKESIYLQIKLTAIRARAAFRNAQNNVKRVQNDREMNEGVPIQEWLKILQIQPVKPSHLAVQKAFTQPLLLISQSEQIAPPEECGGVDLRELYKYLYNACLGLPYKDLDSNSMDFLIYTMKMMNKEMRDRAPVFMKHLSETDFFSTSLGANQEVKPQVDVDVAAIFRESVLNPFGLPEQFFDALESEQDNNNNNNNKIQEN